MDEGLEHRGAEGIMVLEGGVQSDHRHVLRLEGLVDVLRLRDAGGNRLGAQHLECREHDHAAAQAAEQKRSIRVEPGLHQKLGRMG